MGVETQTGSQRLEDGFQSISTDFQSMGTTASGSVCSEHNAQLPQYFTFKMDPGVVAVDAFAQDWSNLTPYAFPPFLMVGRCLQKIWEEKVEKAVIVEESSMVPTTPHEHQQSLPSSPIKGPANEPSGRSTSPHGSGRTDPDHLAGIQQSLESKGISEKAVNLICVSWRRGTEKSYSSAWELWQGWCSKGLIDPLSASLSDIANFLSSEFENGKQYSTLNTYTVLQYQLRTPQSRVIQWDSSDYLQAASRDVQ